MSDRDGEMDNVRNYDTFVTLKIDFDTADNFHTNLGAKYRTFVTTLQLVDEELIVLSANPANRRDPIMKPTDIPNNITGMIPYFYTNSRPAKDKRFSVWATARISHNLGWEDIVETSRYGLTDEGIVMMVKRIQTFKTQIPGYLQFVDNDADPLDLTSQIQADIGTSLTWTLYMREPFELDYANMAAKKKRKKDFNANVPHIECADGEEDQLKATLRKWISTGQASLRFGTHIKFIEALIKTSSPTQVDRTVRMNSHGRRFQASIEMTELQGLVNPNGVITLDKKTSTVRSLILQQTTKDGHPMFLSVTRKWKSPAWQVTYIKQERRSAIEFASCPAAYLGFPLSESESVDLYKHFTPEAVTEAVDAEYEEETERMITPSEKEAIEEESKIANIEWLIDLSAITSPLSEDAPVKFQDGRDFKFGDDISINTTRTKAGTEKTSNSTAFTTPPRRSPPILHNSSSSVASSVTNASRIVDLETGMDRMDCKISRILNMMEQSKANEPPDKQPAQPSPLTGGDGQ